MRGWVVLLWAVLATIVLIARRHLRHAARLGARRAVPHARRRPPRPLPPSTPVVDTTYEVLVLNATPEQGLATQMKDVVVAAGWPTTPCWPSEAGSTDFAETTVYYLAARGRGGRGRASPR